jgi:hypothetical protein
VLEVIGAGAVGAAGTGVDADDAAGAAGAAGVMGGIGVMGAAGADWVAVAEGRSVGIPKLGSPGTGLLEPLPLQPSSTVHVVPAGARVSVWPAAVPLGTETVTVALLPGASEPDAGETCTEPLPPETAMFQ